MAIPKGLFLEETWRLHPAICAYTSEVFYDGKLRSKNGLEKQLIKGSGPISGYGLYLLPVAHGGNQNCSPEEAQAVGRLVRAILAGKATWVDREGQEKPITLDNIVIITPYNAQVFEIQQCLPGARVGTVDKFQGQEAPIAIYSTATSSHADAPRGMEFLYSLNGLLQKLRGVRSGLPDVMVVCRPRSVFVELKSKAGVVSRSQRQVRVELLRTGAHWWMARSARAAMTALRRSGVKFQSSWSPPADLQPWEGPFTDEEKKLPRHPAVREHQREVMRRWRERRAAQGLPIWRPPTEERRARQREYTRLWRERNRLHVVATAAE